LNLKDPIDFINDYVENATKFLENFDDDAERMTDAFRYEKGLFEDLQVVMDSSGQLYHLDFDRFYWGGKFRRPSEEMINKIAKKMGNYFSYIRKLAKLKAKGLLDEYIEENYSSDSEDSDDGDE
jgi:predicted transcriptional regulator